MLEELPERRQGRKPPSDDKSNLPWDRKRKQGQRREGKKVGNDKILSQLKPAVFIYRIGALKSAAGPFKAARLSGKCRHLLTAGRGAFPSTAAARLIIYLQPPSVLSCLWSHAVNITLFIKY